MYLLYTIIAISTSPKKLRLMSNLALAFLHNLW